MSISAFFNRTCVQTAVYWSTPIEDGYGGKVFAEPVEIKVRWEDKDQLLRLDDGNQISSRAVAYVLQDVTLEGMMYLGTLEDLYDDYNTDSSGGALNDPKSYDGAWVIKKIEKSPTLGSTTMSYIKVWLTPLLT